MSFDIHCVAFQNGKSGVGDAEAARRVLSRAKHTLFDNSDSYEIQFQDGSHVALYAGGLAGGEKPFDGAMFVLHGGSWTLSVMEFIRDFAAAAGLAIFPQHPCKVILPFEALLAELPPGLTQDFEPVMAANGHELGLALSDITESPTTERDTSDGHRKSSHEG